MSSYLRIFFLVILSLVFLLTVRLHGLSTCYELSEKGEVVFNNTDSLLKHMKRERLAAISVKSAKMCGISDKGKHIKVRLDFHELATFVGSQFPPGVIIIPPAGAKVVLLDYILLPIGWYKLANNRIYEFMEPQFFGPNPYRLFLLLHEINIDVPTYQEKNIPDQEQRLTS